MVSQNRFFPQDATNPANLESQLRVDAETLLRDLAFVLKMTQRVRDEIRSEQEEPEAALV